ncbi:MAG: hypothetical protein RL069_2513 [Planctomycetota bacterium]|jgi:hypothetical protein
MLGQYAILRMELNQLTVRVVAIPIIGSVAPVESCYEVLMNSTLHEPKRIWAIGTIEFRVG